MHLSKNARLNITVPSPNKINGIFFYINSIYTKETNWNTNKTQKWTVTDEKNIQTAFKNNSKISNGNNKISNF